MWLFGGSKSDKNNENKVNDIAKKVDETKDEKESVKLDKQLEKTITDEISNNDEDLSSIYRIFQESINDKEGSSLEILNTRKQNVLNCNKNIELSEYPETMSCATAFDELFACYSLGGQFSNYYRYGEINNCVPNYEKFYFCVSNTYFSKALEAEKKLEFQKFYKKQYLIKKAKGSSEDIWEIRK